MTKICTQKFAYYISSSEDIFVSGIRLGHTENKIGGNSKMGSKVHPKKKIKQQHTKIDKDNKSNNSKGKWEGRVFSVFESQSQLVNKL